MLLALSFALQDVSTAPAPSIAIVEFTQSARYVGAPQCCPGSDCAQSPESDEICVSELYDVNVRVRRQLGGSRLPARFVLRYMGHAMRLNPPTRMLVAVRPFADQRQRGWMAESRLLARPDGRFCRAEDEIIEWSDPALVRLFMARRRSVMRDLGNDDPTAVQHRCIG